MQVGVCRMTLRLPGNRSLKGKRRTVRSLCDRVRHRFGGSVAEVGAQGSWQMAVIGIAGVSGEATVARALVERAAEYIEASAHEIQVLESEVDTIDLE